MVLFTLLVCLCIAQMLFLGIKLRTQENIQVRHSQGAGDIITKPGEAGTDGGVEYEPRENARIGGEGVTSRSRNRRTWGRVVYGRTFRYKIMGFVEDKGESIIQLRNIQGR